MTSTDTKEESRATNRRRGLSSAGILAEIDLGSPPFSGTSTAYFGEATLRRAALMVRANLVEVEAVNIQDNVAALSGNVRASKGAAPLKVSAVVQKTLPGDWLIDGKTGAEKSEDRTPEIPALMIAAMIEVGALPAFADEGVDGLPTMRLFCTDVRNGILHWDETELRAVLENLFLIEVENPTEEILRKLKGMGIKQVAAIYPCDEIVPEYLDCYAYTGVRRSTQDLFWADFLANRKQEIEELGCEINIDPGLSLDVVEPKEWYGEFQSDETPEQATDWFHFECGIEIEGIKINIIPSIVKYLESKPPGF
ncbi:MAG: hypothetical protein P1V20_02275, partial [Verrucomicrobiales bacterium]|nr:hypothetical protein [Verrucomicrobiales bacterium]